jgi:GTPase SAR1 family protein
MRLQLWDTAGQERFRSLTSNFFGRADGFVLCYDISNRPSFDHVIGWMRDIETRAPPIATLLSVETSPILIMTEWCNMRKENSWQMNMVYSSLRLSALTGHNVETHVYGFGDHYQTQEN